MTQLMVETHDLAKTFQRSEGDPVHAVKGIDLQIRRGEIFSLLGPNGAGKTTTISMISGLIEPTRGDASIGRGLVAAGCGAGIHAGRRTYLTHRLGYGWLYFAEVPQRRPGHCAAVHPGIDRYGSCILHIGHPTLPL